MSATSAPASEVLIAHPGAELYGSDLVLLETVSALVSAGMRVTVALPSTGPLAGELERRGARTAVCPTPVLRKSILRPAGALRFGVDTVRGIVSGFRLLRRLRPDVVYVNTVTLPLWVLLGRLARVPVIAHVHEAERGSAWLVRRALAAPLLLCSSVISNSQHCIDVYCESFPTLRGRSRLVRNPISWPAKPDVARAKLDGALQVVYVGRLSERKGVDTAVHALAEYRASGQDAELHLVGDVFAGYEWYLDRLRALVSATGLTEVVHFHGYQRDVWPFLAMSDIVLVPSILEEGFGNTAVEGILAARPVVVSDTSGLREASAGFASAVRVTPGAASDLANALTLMVRNWPRFRLAAGTDQFLARDRHGVAGYRSSIRQTVLTAGRPQHLLRDQQIGPVPTGQQPARPRRTAPRPAARHLAHQQL